MTVSFVFQVQNEIRKAWFRFRLTHQRNFRDSCRGRTGANSTFTTYMSRARESIGSLQHAQDERGKPDGRLCSYPLVDKTPLDSSSDMAERLPLTNGRDVHGKGLEVQPILRNGSSGHEGDGRDDSGNGVIKDEYRVN